MAGYPRSPPDGPMLTENCLPSVAFMCVAVKGPQVGHF